MSNYDSYGTPTKPESNCRTCTDFKFWSKQQRQIFNKAGDVRALGISRTFVTSVIYCFFYYYDRTKMQQQLKQT